jgi:subtilisin
VPDESTTNDYHGHGTHCAGTVAAAMNGQGVVGVAPAAYLYAVKVLNRYGSGQYSWIIAGIDWCVSKKRMNVISMSLGGGADVNALQKMCDTAYAEGVLIIAAAGNSGPPPAGQPSSVGYPARYDSVVAVSAIGSDNVIAGFSSRGPEVELCAPGVQVLSTYPVNNYHKMSGTSMACPHVAGAAAMAWGSHRFQNNRTIRTLLQQSADNLGNPGRDPLYGFGRVDAWQATLTMSMP